jgi:hypothetical protein
MRAQLGSPGKRPHDLLIRVLSIADEPGDGDDARLRKRVGVIAGYVTIFAPFSLLFSRLTPETVSHELCCGRA